MCVEGMLKIRLVAVCAEGVSEVCGVDVCVSTVCYKYVGFLFCFCRRCVVLLCVKVIGVEGCGVVCVKGIGVEGRCTVCGKGIGVEGVLKWVLLRVLKVSVLKVC